METAPDGDNEVHVASFSVSYSLAREIDAMFGFFRMILLIYRDGTKRGWWEIGTPFP